MGRQSSGSIHSRSESETESVIDVEMECPFERIDTLRRSDLRESAYELFFMSCRSCPGFGGRNSLNYYPSHGEGNGGGGGGGGECSPTPAKGAAGTGVMVNSKLKKLLGLKPRKSTLMKTVNQTTGSGSAVSSSPGNVRRPMTSAEIMRQQMQVTEQSDGQLRKTLMRTLVGQVGRKAETIILPLELLRQLKPSDFSDSQQYHQWQRRQLKILEAGLLLHPSIPVDKFNSAAIRLKEVIRGSETKAIDTSKLSDIMRILCDSVFALAWRSPPGAGNAPVEACHWADGYPMNLHLYSALLQSIFDLKEETVVLDEVDELVELMKKTWSTLGLNKQIHNVCFAWVMFRQYVETGQVEPDLLCATLVLLAEVSNDAKKAELDTNYGKILSAVMSAMQNWAEKRLLDYHESFDKESLPNMENILSLSLSTGKIIDEVLRAGGKTGSEELIESNSTNRVDSYIRSSLKSAFNKFLENATQPNEESMILEIQEDPSKALLQLAKDAEDLILIEKDIFSPVLQKWHQLPTSVATVTVHNCYGLALKEYIAKITIHTISDELVLVLQSAAKLENLLVQMVVEDSVDSEDGGKGIVREMIPYEVENVVVDLIKTWIDERMKIGNECVLRAKETESWIPRSKNEPFAQSAVDLMKLAKVTVDEFSEIPVGARDSMAQVLSDGLEAIFQDYINFVAQCGSKQSYIPSLPPLTRCNQDSRISKLWKKAATLRHPVSCSKPICSGNNGSNQPRISTSRGTQRLYIRLNTLHYILAHLHALDKSVSFFSRPNPAPTTGRLSGAHRRVGTSCHFEPARSSALSAIQYVTDVAAYRLIFLDSRHSFYDGLYAGDMAESRFRPATRTLKQSLTLMVSILTDRAQPLAIREVMKASFEAFLMVLLAGGSERAFAHSDYDMIAEDFKNLKKVFSAKGEGLVAEDVVDKEAEVVEGIVELMGQPTEKLVEDFCTAACESSGMGELGGGEGRKVPMPPTTGRWNRADPNTILRVLCYRDDEAANMFLKKMFQLPKRK